MQRFWIHHVLPVVFCALPVAAAGLIFAAIPPDARRDYLDRVSLYAEGAGDDGCSGDAHAPQPTR